MPDITFRESEIVIKQKVKTVSTGSGNAYVGRPTSKMIASGEYDAVLILTKKEV
ncbi:MAG: hypothetical protein GQ576_00155 [Methanococcoides sp.]|nr:hypothetical protein [Methanococcoides sp.]